MFISLTSSAHINMFKSCKSFIMVHVQPTTWDLHLELLFRSNSGRRLTCAHKIDSVAHTGFCLTCTHKSVSVVHTEPSGDGVGLVNVIIFLAVQQTQALLIHDQLLVGCSCAHTGTATLSSFLLSSRHRHCSCIMSYRWGGVG